MKKSIKIQNYTTLITDLASLIEQGCKAIMRYVNTALVSTYWLMDRRIMEYEQKGKKGQTSSAELSSILQTPSEESTLPLKSQTVSGKFQKGYTLCSQSEIKILHKVYEISETLSRKLKDRDFWK